MRHYGQIKHIEFFGLYRICLHLFPPPKDVIYFRETSMVYWVECAFFDPIIKYRIFVGIFCRYRLSSFDVWCHLFLKFLRLVFFLFQVTWLLDKVGYLSHLLLIWWCCYVSLISVVPFLLGAVELGACLFRIAMPSFLNVSFIGTMCLLFLLIYFILKSFCQILW